MDRRTFFRMPSAPFDNVPSMAVGSAKELSSEESSHIEKARGKGSLLGGAALISSGVMFAGHEIATGSLDNPLQIATSSLASIVLLMSGGRSCIEGSLHLETAHEYAVKSGIERATAVKVASELETTPIEPPVKERHLYLVK